MGWLARRVYQNLEDLHEAIEDLKASFPDGCPEDIEIASKNIRHIQATMPTNGLPQYEEAHSLRAPINSCLGFLQVQLMIPFQTHPLSVAQIQQIEAAIYLTRQFMYDFYQLCYRDKFAWFVDVHADHAPEIGPLFISHLLAWPHIHRKFAGVGFTLTTPAKLSFPPVLYHPHFTPDLWERLLFMMQPGTERIVHITPCAETQGLALKITKGDIQMTPIRWNDLINPRWREGYYEPLYELGGSLMPLTYDEGYGQGIVLRLPWAKTDRERR